MRLTARTASTNERTLSLQEKYAPNNACWGCGPANAEGLRIRSFPEGDEVVAEWKPEPKYEAFPGVLNGGIIGTLLDCHCNWTAAWHLMKQAGDDHPPCTVTADYAIKLLRPTPTNGPVFLSAKVVDSSADRATIEGTLSGGRKSLRDLPRHIRRGERRPSGVSSLVREFERAEARPCGRTCFRRPVSPGVVRRIQCPNFVDAGLIEPQLGFRHEDI